MRTIPKNKNILRIRNNYNNNNIKSLLVNLLIFVVFLNIILVECTLIVSASKPLQVIYAINAGGDEHVDKFGIRYEADPLRGKIGTESDYGKQLLMIGRVSQDDEILYQTERYHTATFGYDVPVSGDGEYALILKFCEVYFNAPNMKVFDVILNGDHTVIADLDIFAQVGKGVAHDEYIYFTVSRGKLYYKEEESEIRGGKIRVEFIKGIKDNPKINAIALLKGDVERIPKLPPIMNDDLSIPEREMNSHHQSSPSSPSPSSPPSSSSYSSNNNNINSNNNMETDIPHEDILNTDKQQPTVMKSRKTSGPKQPDPYAMDDTSAMLPVFIAIGAFIPLLFCLCKL